MSVDRDQIAAQLGFKRSDVDMLLAIFSKNAAASLQEMQTMIAEGDMQGIADAAHAIKGSAGNFRLDAIYTLAMEIETAAKNGADEDYTARYEQLRVLLDSL